MRQQPGSSRTEGQLQETPGDARRGGATSSVQHLGIRPTRRWRVEMNRFLHVHVFMSWLHLVQSGSTCSRQYLCEIHNPRNRFPGKS